jgi:hypothetical protein
LPNPFLCEAASSCTSANPSLTTSMSCHFLPQYDCGITKQVLSQWIFLPRRSGGGRD